MIRIFETNPIIAAVRNDEEVFEAINTPVEAIFLLYGNILKTPEIIEHIHKKEKKVFVHLDFIQGLGKDNYALDYVFDNMRADGIISTRNNHIQYARSKGVFAIQRFFIVDSQSYRMAINSIKRTNPNMVELMPGLMEGIIKKTNSKISVPIIVGGLIETKNQVIKALGAGAIAASTSKKELWLL